MKKLCLIFILGVCSSQLHSQVLISLLFGDKLNSEGVEFGLDGGLNFSKISGFEGDDFMRTFNLGFYFDFQLKKSPWSLRTGVMVKSSRGVDGLSTNDLLKIDSSFQFDGDGVYSQKLSYFDVPMMIKYKLKNNFYAEVGGQICLLNKGSIVYEEKEGNRTELIETENRDLLNRIDAGFLGGVGYKFRKGKGLTLGVWYYQGLTNVYKAMPGNTNSALTFKILIPVGAGKKKKKDKKETE
jgi:hypothetical protein